MKYITVLITVPNKKISDKITHSLMTKKLVSCVNVINNIFSVYRWENKIRNKKEHLLICKSTKNKFLEIVKDVKKIHPYKVAEIVCFEIQNGSADYLKWIKSNVE